MKKLGQIISVILVILFVFSACSQTNPNPSQAPQSTAPSAAPSASPEGSAVPEKPELPQYKIGILSFKYTGPWVERINEALKPLADAYNCEFINGNPAATPDEVLSGVENLCASGVNGIIAFATGSMTSRIMETCEKAKVFFIACENDASLDSGYETTKMNDYFVGSVAPNDYQTMYDITKEMIDKGLTKFATLGMPPGTAATFDNRLNGATAAVTEAGLTLAAEARSFNVTEAGQNLLTQNPDIEAILSGVDTTTYIEQPLLAAGLNGKVQVTTFEDGGDVLNAFKQGTITYACDGANARAQICFALLYNAISGNRLANADGSAPVINMDNLIMRSEKDYQTFLDKSAFSLEEIQKIIVVTTAGASLDNVNALAADFKMDNLA
ncbi:MAG: substrate-binding domain-containing protein [Clostridiales bacterium]|nr:substrate-binding domain-containing protein [Clostridiales bacterium]